MFMIYFLMSGSGRLFGVRYCTWLQMTISLAAVQNRTRTRRRRGDELAGGRLDDVVGAPFRHRSRRVPGDGLHALRGEVRRVPRAPRRPPLPARQVRRRQLPRRRRAHRARRRRLEQLRAHLYGRRRRV